MASVRIEKRRGFQPPWYKVMIFDCGCGQTTLRMRKGPGAVACGTGKHLLGLDGTITERQDTAPVIRCAFDNPDNYAP